MTKTQFTDGPWVNDRGTITAWNGLGGLVQVVAECHVYDSARNKLSGAERDANAVLTAAAPEMFQAIDEFLAEIDAHGGYSETCAVGWMRDVMAKIARNGGS